MSDQVRNLRFHTLSDEWATLKRVTFDYRRRDGAWETQVRQTYDRGDGAVILPYDPDRGTVLLTRQFRIPAYVTGHPEPLIEAAAGLLDADDPRPPSGARPRRSWATGSPPSPRSSRSI